MIRVTIPGRAYGVLLDGQLRYDEADVDAAVRAATRRRAGFGYSFTLELGEETARSIRSYLELFASLDADLTLEESGRSGRAEAAAARIAVARLDAELVKTLDSRADCV